MNNERGEFTTSILAVHPGDHTDWAKRHNLAVFAWNRDYASANETVVLNYAFALWTLLHSEWGRDGYVMPNVTEPLAQSFHDLLNIDLGRLDGGTLSSWLCDLADHYQIAGVL